MASVCWGEVRADIAEKLTMIAKTIRCALQSDAMFPSKQNLSESPLSNDSLANPSKIIVQSPLQSYPRTSASRSQAEQGLHQFEAVGNSQAVLLGHDEGERRDESVELSSG